MNKKANTNLYNRRIKYALYFKNWLYNIENKNVLKQCAIKVLPSEYNQEMDGSIFCPICCTNLNRVPKRKEYFSNGRDAYFSHIAKFKDIKCDLKSKKPEGKRYKFFEEAKKAIDDENLVIINGFIKKEPELPKDNNKSEYDETPVEDINGDISDVPIARHNGKSFKLPSKITTVAGICRNFEENRDKYYYFPDQKNAIRLLDTLNNIENVENEDNIPRLYYGIIKRSFNAGYKPTNIRMTELKCHKNIRDFFLKDIDRVSTKKGITDNSHGRIVVIYGRVTKNGIGLGIENLRWGEYALLPEKYNSLLV